MPSRTPKSLFRPATSLPAQPRAAVLQTIWDIVAMIPRGKVSTYGQVARAAGLLRGARQAGYALRMMPPGMRLPWHRVVGAGGRIVFPKSSTQYREQAQRLRAEGVAVTAGRVDPAAMANLEEL
jgi:methylated-DNA-protein-cysteine methyltransferase-like protein